MQLIFLENNCVFLKKYITNEKLKILGVEYGLCDKILYINAILCCALFLKCCLSVLHSKCVWD